MSLTPKQELFAQSIVKGMTQSDAYRKAYDTQNMADATIHNEASDLMKHPEVAMRVGELREPIVLKAQITLESHLDRLNHLSKLAENTLQISAAISAEVARAKAAGLTPDKLEIKHGGTIGHEPFTPEQLADAIANGLKEF